MNIKERLSNIQVRINRASKIAGCDPSKIRIVAVMKTVEVEQIQQALACGIQNIGENRVQEAWRKYQQLEHAAAKWHMVGHLQRNKVKQALKFFDLIHSLDSIELAREINQRLDTIPREIELLVEVNTSGEATKYGLRPEDTADFVAKVSNLPHLRIAGLMTIGRLSPDAEDSRECFRTLRNLFEKLSKYKHPNVSMKYLSMGMTNDFELAIQEGANIIRIGRAIFGERQEHN
ncbi:YggS family pyridoxal phosphate-dependent enzyme [candidate division KSB1 bacterium]|nr:YggS family pyridoxal phosphate-dependent enzyme [candidate division KSB1 bacterium]